MIIRSSAREWVTRKRLEGKILIVITFLKGDFRGIPLLQIWKFLLDKRFCSTEAPLNRGLGVAKGVNLSIV